MFQRPHRRSVLAVRKDYRVARRKLAADPSELLKEIRSQPLEWLESQWKWHVETRFCVLRAGTRRGYPGSELTSGHSQDRPNLLRLTELPPLLEGIVPDSPVVAWLGWMPHGARIFLHVDNTAHWDEHHRVHVPLVTNPGARACVEGRFTHLGLGNAWVLNNSVPHGALNRGPDRLHLVMDYAPSESFAAWLSGCTRVEGDLDAAAFEELKQDPLDVPAARQIFDSARLGRMLVQ